MQRESARASGMPAQVLNLAMDTEGGTRPVRVHSAVAHGVRGASWPHSRGLIRQGRSHIRFAPDRQHSAPRAVRDYVDVTALKVEAQTPGEAADALRADFEQIKSALRTDDMHLNVSKEQVYGVTQADRRLGGPGRSRC